MEHGEEAFLGKASRSQTPTRGQRLPVSTLDAQSHVIREGPSQKIKQGGVSSDLTPLCLLQVHTWSTVDCPATPNMLRHLRVVTCKPGSLCGRSYGELAAGLQW